MTLVLVALSLLLQARANPCSSGQTFKCSDGSTPSGHPPCRQGKPQCCTGSTCTAAPKPSGMGPSPSPGGGPGGAKPCVNPTCASPPCAARLLGDVGCTTVSGTEAYNHEIVKKGGTIASNSHIYGPFEAGFTSRQDSIIQGWGCTDPSVAYDSHGGTDIVLAEARTAHLCKVTLPRVEGDRYIGVVGPCGGHTKDYHFHRSFNCLYKESGGHSTAVGIVGQWKMYGKWEDYDKQLLPFLDACGGHFGPTPDSGGKSVYHYHVQERAPLTVGCHGPTADNKLVSVAQCRALYSECSDAPVDIEIGPGKIVSYVRFCPCYDADGSNSGTIKELPALSTTAISFSASGGAPSPLGQTKPTPAPAPGSSPGPQPAPSPVPGPTPSAGASTSAARAGGRLSSLLLLAAALQRFARHR